MSNWFYRVRLIVGTNFESISIDFPVSEWSRIREELLLSIRRSFRQFSIDSCPRSDCGWLEYDFCNNFLSVLSYRHAVGGNAIMHLQLQFHSFENQTRWEIIFVFYLFIWLFIYLFIYLYVVTIFACINQLNATGAQQLRRADATMHFSDCPGSDEERNQLLRTGKFNDARQPRSLARVAISNKI